MYSKKITEARFEKMKSVLANRTDKLVVVLEDIFQHHNASAVFRNCDAFGIQNVTLIENKYLHFADKNVDVGAGKWLSINRYISSEAVAVKQGNAIANKHIITPEANRNTTKALMDLKNSGYVLVASSLQENSVSISDIPTDKPLALMIGSERMGLSDTAIALADYTFKMPMLGFVQSLNLSVFTALCLAELSNKIRESSDDWHLSDSRKNEILQNWLDIK